MKSPISITTRRVYVLSHRPSFSNRSRLWCYKIGYASNVRSRVSDITRSLSEHGVNTDIKVWAAIPLLSSIIFEKAFHRSIGKHFRSKSIPAGSSGWTEWLDWPNVLTALFVFLWVLPVFNTPVQVSGAVSLAVMLAPIPIDLMLIAFSGLLIEVFILNAVIHFVTGFSAVHAVKDLLTLIFG